MYMFTGMLSACTKMHKHAYYSSNRNSPFRQWIYPAGRMFDTLDLTLALGGDHFRSIAMF